MWAMNHQHTSLEAHFDMVLEVSLLANHPRKVVPLHGYFFRLPGYFFTEQEDHPVLRVGMLTRQSLMFYDKIKIRLSKTCQLQMNPYGPILISRKGQSIQTESRLVGA
jgi:hypothetical protein